MKKGSMQKWFGSENWMDLLLYRLMNCCCWVLEKCWKQNFVWVYCFSLGSCCFGMLVCIGLLKIWCRYVLQFLLVGLMVYFFVISFRNFFGCRDLQKEQIGVIFFLWCGLLSQEFCFFLCGQGFIFCMWCGYVCMFMFFFLSFVYWVCMELKFILRI